MRSVLAPQPAPSDFVAPVSYVLPRPPISISGSLRDGLLYPRPRGNKLRNPPPIPAPRQRKGSSATGSSPLLLAPDNPHRAALITRRQVLAGSSSHRRACGPIDFIARTGHALHHHSRQQGQHGQRKQGTLMPAKCDPTSPRHPCAGRGRRRAARRRPRGVRFWR